MKALPWILICLLFCPVFIEAQISSSNDSTGHNQKTQNTRKEKRKLARKQMSDRFKIALYGTYAFINSSARFETPNSILGVNIDLEDHFGLPDKKMIYYGTFVYRITPRSGINAMFYSLNRSEEHILKEDIIFLGDTIPKGLGVSGFMNSSVASLGYLFTIISDEKSFFGAFLNLYVTSIKVGVNSDVYEISKSVHYLTATPNIGLIASFKLKEWMALSGGVGFFLLNTEEWGGSFHDLQIMADFFPLKWLALSVGYQAFDIRGKFLEENYTAHLNYNLKGPTFGLKFSF